VRRCSPAMNPVQPASALAPTFAWRWGERNREQLIS
jgi:hypothetical protein